MPGSALLRCKSPPPLPAPPHPTVQIQRLKFRDEEGLKGLASHPAHPETEPSLSAWLEVSQRQISLGP